MGRNTDAFAEYELLPSQLSDVSTIDTRSSLFGRPVEWPVIISPTGASRLFHRDGEPAVARAAGIFGMPYSLSTVGTTTIEEVLIALQDSRETAAFEKRLGGGAR